MVKSKLSNKKFINSYWYEYFWNSSRTNNLLVGGDRVAGDSSSCMNEEIRDRIERNLIKDGEKLKDMWMIIDLPYV